MPANASALGKLARLGLSAYNSGDSGAITVPLSFSDFRPNCVSEPINLAQQTGGMSNLGDAIELSRFNIRRANPTSTHKPSMIELHQLLQSIFNVVPTGTGVVGDPYIYTPPAAGLATDRNIGYHDTQRYWKIIGAVCAKAVFSAQSPGEMMLDIEWAARDYSNSGSYPSLGISGMIGPRLLFTDANILIGALGVPINTRSIRLTVDHDVDNNRFFNGATSAGPVNRQRKYDLSLDIPYGLHPSMHTYCDVDGGRPVTITFQNSATGSTLVLTGPAMRAAGMAPDSKVPEETFVPFSATLFEDRTNAVAGLTASLIM